MLPLAQSLAGCLSSCKVEPETAAALKQLLPGALLVQVRRLGVGDAKCGATPEGVASTPAWSSVCGLRSWQGCQHWGVALRAAAARSPAAACCLRRRHLAALARSQVTLALAPAPHVQLRSANLLRPGWLTTELQASEGTPQARCIHECARKALVVRADGSALPSGGDQ